MFFFVFSKIVDIQIIGWCNLISYLQNQCEFSKFLLLNFISLLHLMPSPRENFQKAFAAALEKKYEDAKFYYRETLALNPEYSMAWSNLGWILYD